MNILNRNASNNFYPNAKKDMTLKYHLLTCHGYILINIYLLYKKYINVCFSPQYPTIWLDDLETAVRGHRASDILVSKETQYYINCIKQVFSEHEQAPTPSKSFSNISEDSITFRSKVLSRTSLEKKRYFGQFYNFWSGIFDRNAQKAHLWTNTLQLSL